MAKIGLRHIAYKTAASAALIGKAIKADIKINTDKGELRGDDVIAEKHSIFQDGSISLNTTDLSAAVQSALLGHVITDGEMVGNVDDVTVDSGIGFYAVIVVNGTKKYRAIWFLKVNFSEPEDSHETKGEKITYSTHTIEGTIMIDDSGNWKKEKTFDTEAAAIAYIDALAGITAQCTKPTANVASGTYTETKEVTLTGAVGETIYYTTNGTTPSATNGTEYTTAISIAASCALKAIAVKSGLSNSEIATYEYIITA